MPHHLKLRALLSGIFILWTSLAFGQQSDVLTANEAFRLSIDRDANGQIELQWQIADGYYMYRSQMSAKDATTGDAVTLETAQGIMKPDDPNFGPSEVYYNQTSATLGADVQGLVNLNYQGCKKDSICYPPITVVLDTENLQISEAATGFGPRVNNAADTQSSSSFFSTITTTPSQSDQQEAVSLQVSNDTEEGNMIGALLEHGGAIWVVLSFVAFGLLLAFTPCVLPMFPILSATLAREGEALTMRRGFILSSTYVFTMALAFGFLGVVAAWSGQNLQVALQSPYAIAAISALFVALGGSMFGFYDLQLPSSWVSRISGVQSGARGSIIGAAIMGFISALVVGPCVTAPLAGALLYIAQTGDAWLGAAALFGLGVGQGIPLIAFGTMGGRALPKTGAWMEQVKYLFGFVFLGTSIWMLSRLVSPQLELGLWAFLLLTMAVFLGALDQMPSPATVIDRFRKSLALAFVICASLLALGAATGGTKVLQPLSHISQGQANYASTAELAFTNATSFDELENLLATANGKPALVYFTADWCVKCKSVESEVLPGPAIIAALEGFQSIKIDLSELSPGKVDLMRRLSVVGPPTMIFFDTNGKEIRGTRLVGDVSVESLQASINQVNAL